jgi:hypothetical protein
MYKRYELDVPLTYETDIYKTNPFTGSIYMVNEECGISFEILHKKGDVVLDEHNVQVMKHRKGDIILKDGVPVLDGESHIHRLIDLFLIDAKYYYATDIKSVTYTSEVINSVVEWTTTNLAEFNRRTLEQTKIFYKPKITSGIIKVTDDRGNVTSIESAQKLAVSIYVKDSIYNNTNIRESISISVIKKLTSLINNSTVSTGIIISEIMNDLKEVVSSISITGIGGDKNLQTVTVVDDTYGLSIAKKIYLRSDGNLIVLEDISIDFYNVLTDV